MQIYGPYRVSTTQPTGPASRPQPAKPQAASTPANQVDQLDLSSSVGSVNRLNSVADSADSDIRVDRVADIRRQIASGTYDTPEKLDAALDKFLDQYA